MGGKGDIVYLIKKFTHDKIGLLLSGSPWSRAMLARLRRGIAKQPGELPELYEIYLEGMPEKLYSREGKPSYPEWAIYNALTLFALHQQGKGHDNPMSVGWSPESNEAGNSLGGATGMLVSRDREREPAIKRRFDAVVTAAVFTELAYHARGMVQLFRAEGIPLDYPRFAEDLYWYQFTEHKNRVRMRWGEDYYRITRRKTETEDGEVQDE